MTTNKIKVTHLPDFKGEPILASCLNCAYLYDENDDPYSMTPWHVCNKEGREFMGNLKNFPFKSPQSCCELADWFLIDYESISKQETEHLKNDH